MPLLTARVGDDERCIHFNVGQSLRDILDATDVRVRSGCGGGGACGLCRVSIMSGEVGEPTLNEQLSLDSAELSQGIRLACQVMPKQDTSIVILALAPESRWRNLPEGAGGPDKGSLGLPSKDQPGGAATSYGVAVDLGTTHISLSLYELSRGKWLAGRYGLNPQMRYGSDVMTRLVAASESPDKAQDMSRQAVKAIGEALFDMATREGIGIQQVVRVALVGNTAMLALLSGRNYELLLQPGHWMNFLDCLPESPDAWAVSWGVHPQARIEIVPPLAGFVGSDLLAGAVATHLADNGVGALFVDFGTNSEIALWDGRVLWVTSAAGGPAFEESGISCGVPAEPGAIYRASLRDGAFDVAVIADGEPRGVCGSGLVDVIAGLVRSGRLSKMGHFVPPVPSTGFALAQGVRTIVLTERDVDMFQRAKAAVATGIQALLAQASMGYGDLGRVCVGGYFGRFLDVANAQEIGLLPRISPGLVELCGNTALAGCAEALLSAAGVGRLENLRRRAEVINLSSRTDFGDLFLGNLYLSPMTGE